jgi:hypothetical protein
MLKRRRGCTVESERTRRIQQTMRRRQQVLNEERLLTGAKIKDCVFLTMREVVYGGSVEE